MNFTDRPLSPPHTCCVIPGRGAAMEPRGFIDTQNELGGIDPHVYVSFAGAELLARKIGWVSGEELGDAQREIAALRTRVEELEQELQEADQFKAHIDGLTRHGLTVKKVAGRKPKPKTPVEA